jgi:outer membrane receptor protein involved in Fe transport
MNCSILCRYAPVAVQLPFVVAGQYSVRPNFDVAVGFKNLTGEKYELAWGFPQQGRTFSIKTRVGL